MRAELGLVAAFASFLLGAHTLASQQAVYRAGTDAVSIDVTVRRGKRPVTGLTGRDFELKDNGVVQQVAARVAADRAVDVSFVFDYTDFAEDAMRGLSTSRFDEIARELHPTDRLRVIAFATDVREIVSMQPVSGILRRSGAAAVPSPAERLRGTPLTSPLVGFDRRHDPALRHSSLFDALILALARPPEPDRRHVVIAFCAGTDAGSVASDGRFLTDIAARADAVLFVAFWQGQLMGVPMIGLRQAYTLAVLRETTATTGGAIQEISAGIGALRSILEDFREGYLLTYTATGVDPAGWHDITVKVPAHPEYDVRARKGYVGR